MDKRILLPSFLIILIGAALAIYSPYNSLSRCNASLDRILLHKAGSSNTIFIVYLDFNNPSNEPIVVGEIDANMQINGTDYNSLDLISERYTIPPKGELRISIPIMNTGSPIGYQQNGTIQKYSLKTEVLYTKSTSSLGISAERTETLTDSQNWTYNKELS